MSLYITKLKGFLQVAGWNTETLLYQTEHIASDNDTAVGHTEAGGITMTGSQTGLSQQIKYVALVTGQIIDNNGQGMP